jgi:hypothetical protein
MSVKSKLPSLEDAPPEDAVKEPASLAYEPPDTSVPADESVGATV